MRRKWTTMAAVCGVLALGAASAMLTRAEEKNNKPASTTNTVGLETGVAAPDFALPDQNNKVHKLSDYKGKTVVLAFYPADMTAGCTLEARGLTQALGEFQKRGVQVFGISVQDVNSKKKFCGQEGITYPLLADTEKSVSVAYKVLSPRGVAQRVTFVVGADGKVAQVERNVNPRTHAQDLLALLDRVQANANAPAKVTIDQAVAPFTLPNYDGAPVTVGNWNENGRKATVILFIATKCPISNAYNARMAKLAQDYTPRHVRFIGINPNKAELAPEVAEHAKKNNFSFPVLKDAGNLIADRFEANVTPEIYVMDDKGVLRYHGYIDDNRDESQIKSRDLQAALDAMLSGKPVPVKETRAFGCTIKRVEK